ncbi:MAG: phosphotransferase [Terracoccus sp.]
MPQNERVLTDHDATAVSQAFGLGPAATLAGPMARGHLGQVWRLTTTSGSYAVKEWFARPDLESVRRNARFSEAIRAAGVLTPAVIRTPNGSITANVAGAPFRVFEWVDLGTADRGVDPAAVGELVARLHRTAPVSSETVSPWFSVGVGAGYWYELLEKARSEEAPFAPELANLVDHLIAVEQVIEPPEQTRVCHRDLWADNVLPVADGRVCIIDFDNLGPADPSHELAMVLFEFGRGDPERARTLHQAYVDAGGPGRVTRPGHFAMVVAEQAHIGTLALSRWIEAADTAETDNTVERARLAGWFDEVLDDPLTLTRIDRIVAAVT